MNIVVYGANSAIASATCRIWAGRRDYLFLVGRNPQTLDAAVSDLRVRAGHQKIFGRVADLADTDRQQQIFDEAVKNLGSVDLVFIAHGDLGDQQLGQKDFAHVRKLIEINCLSPLSILTEAANYFEQRGAGAIAVISSVAGDRGRASNYVYASAKGALTIFLSGLRGRLSPTRIPVTNLKLGFVDTPMTSAFRKGPLWAKPDSVALAIVKAIDSKKDDVYIPWFWFWIMLIIKQLPEMIFKKLRF